MKKFSVSFWPCTESDPLESVAAGGCEENMFEAQKKPGVPDPKPLSSGHTTH